MRSKRPDPEPEVRNGICCGEGCRQYDTLYKVPGIYRYRCAGCYLKETGRFHPDTPAQVIHNVTHTKTSN